jgi:hypothetical protein
VSSYNLTSGSITQNPAPQILRSIYIYIYIYTAPLLLLYCCFTAAFGSITQNHAPQILRSIYIYIYIYILLLYCCFTAALLQARATRTRRRCTSFPSLPSILKRYIRYLHLTLPKPLSLSLSLFRYIRYLHLTPLPKPLSLSLSLSSGTYAT